MSENENKTEISNKDQEALKPKKKVRKKFVFGMKLMKGFSWNPLINLPRNNLCPCKSGKKFKVCCLLVLPRVVTNENANYYKKQMENSDMVFMTKDNQEKLKSLIKE